MWFSDSKLTNAINFEWIYIGQRFFYHLTSPNVYYHPEWIQPAHSYRNREWSVVWHFMIMNVICQLETVWSSRFFNFPKCFRWQPNAVPDISMMSQSVGRCSNTVCYNVAEFNDISLSKFWWLGFIVSGELLLWSRQLLRTLLVVHMSLLRLRMLFFSHAFEMNDSKLAH